MIYDTINPEIIKFILKDKPKAGIRILDVGCGTGKLGIVLKPKFNCYLCGIEIDKEAASIVGVIYDEVALFDLKGVLSGNMIFSPKNKFDYIVLGDVLEHVTDPTALLRLLSAHLSEKGIVIASISNVANWIIRLKILFGKFDYSGGILDKGHLRFFSYKSARELLEDNGYKITAVINNN